MRNKTLTRIIIATLLCAFLTFTVGKVTRVSALAVGPLADPVYDTEIFAFKDYVEQNLTQPQLDIMFFLIGGLAVAQMGAQDAMLISPYPNEENVKEWIINCGIQLYNSVIGLVPEGDYYMGIPSIGTSGTKGVPRQVIKGLVAQMMGNAVVAINYPDLDTFLEENPDQILLPFNADLQLGVNAVFGLNGGIDNWQRNVSPFKSNITFKTYNMNASLQQQYLTYYQNLPSPKVRSNKPSSNTYNYYSGSDFFHIFDNLFFDTTLGKFYLCDDNGNLPTLSYFEDKIYYYLGNNYITFYDDSQIDSNFLLKSNFNLSNFNTARDLVQAVYNNTVPFISSDNYVFFEDFITHIYMGTQWSNKIEITNETDLNLSNLYSIYYDQVENDYLFDLRGLMGDLVNYVYLNPIWDNIYDFVGNLVLPDRVKVSVDLTPITDLLSPPVPVNLNDFALYTENDYLEEIRDRSEKFGETIGQYFVFWHNADPVTVYVIFGSVIVILLGAFVGKLGHS